MRANFTPGPWRIGDKHQTDIYAARAGHAIARTVNPHYAGECEANARLIASAPELLKALDTLTLIVGLTAFKYAAQTAVLQEAIDLARDAIAKATGVAV